MPSTGLTVLWFLGVVALIPLTLWLLKRSGLAQGQMGASANLLRTVSQLNIGPGQRLMTVEVGSGEARTWLVLGVTAQHIQTLHTMAPETLPDAPAPAVPGFAALLQRTVGARSAKSQD